LYFLPDKNNVKHNSVDSNGGPQLLDNRSPHQRT